MDWLQDTYTTRMRFGTDPSQSIKIKWQWAQPGALTLPVDYAFGSRWFDYYEIWGDIGEIQYATRKYDRGAGETSALPGTDLPCGDPAVWARGYQGTIPPDFPLNWLGNSGCCGGLMNLLGEPCLCWVPQAEFVPFPVPAVPFKKPKVKSDTLPTPRPAKRSFPWHLAPPALFARSRKPHALAEESRRRPVPPPFPFPKPAPFILQRSITTTAGLVVQFALTNPTTAGNLLFAWIVTAGGLPLAPAGWSLTWFGPCGTAFGWLFQYVAAPSITFADFTIATASANVIASYEIAGASPTSPIDQTSGFQGTSNSASPPPTGVTANALELAIFFVAFDAGATLGAATDGFTLDQSATFFYSNAGIFTLTLTSTQIINVAADLGVPTPWTAFVVTIQ